MRTMISVGTARGKTPEDKTREKANSCRRKIGWRTRTRWNQVFIPTPSPKGSIHIIFALIEGVSGQTLPSGQGKVQ